ncbi:hypothetical protein TNCV_4452491 [Trichonephila clavipes]|nr:hypothetical protein TNCV_4452491 [Trichonephila clavipes]
MNSPDYDDFTVMSSVPIPVSPLPPTPVASSSHEPSQDVIYDSLPPMEQSIVSETPLKNTMEPSRLSESPLKVSVDSKPPVVSKPPIVSKPPVVSISPIVSKLSDPTVKKTQVKKVDSVIHRSPRSRERRNEKRRNEERRNEAHQIPGCIEVPISDPRIKGPECFGDPLMHSN